VILVELIKITDLTQRLDISSRTLRYYEQIGLLQSVRPTYEKYRYYDGENIERLRQIMILRKMQVPVKDILRIFDSRDMSVVVETFAGRIRAIDHEIDALSELKRIVNEFLQAMLQNGVKHISALPLLYEEMGRQLERLEHRKPATYKELSAVAEKLAGPVEVKILELPSMRVLTSIRKDTGLSDAEGFWDWLDRAGLQFVNPGRHELFEYQTDAGQTVMIRKLDEDYRNDSPFEDRVFEGGLFAVGSVYADEDMSAFHRRMLQSFDGNSYFEVDYRTGGHLRHETLAEAVISPDGRREKLELFLPVKRRLPDATLYDPNEQLEGITLQALEEANPILWEKSVPMAGLTPVENPYYRVNAAGEAEYAAGISLRKLATNVAVKLPFRVDIEFKIDAGSARYGYGTDEGSILIHHNGCVYGINTNNNPDERLSKEAISFNQPIFGDFCRYPKQGRIIENAYNRLTWIVGERHFAVIINGEVRYCGVGFPYMKTDLRQEPPCPVLVGSNGQGKVTFRSIRVSQLKLSPQIRIKEGALSMVTKQSNNMIPVIHQLVTSHYGENYWFNGCAKYVMECLGEPDYDYWFFAGITGDNLTQVYPYDHFRGDCATDFRLSVPGNGRTIEEVFAACGYAGSYVTEKALRANREMYLATLMAYIDKGVPVIRYQRVWSVIVGYEDYGKTLLQMTADNQEPERISLEAAIPEPEASVNDQELFCGWFFIGEKKRQADLKQLYRDAILRLPGLLTTKTAEYCFGPEAFRAWAADIESGKFDTIKPEEFDGWCMYTNYVCILATNSGGCQGFLEKAQALNPDFAFLERVRACYRRTGDMWNSQNGEDLEALGGGFNITLEALQDRMKRDKITAKLREFAACMDEVVAILRENLRDGE
jgi:DNA-binding transcriptional MerR regulator